MRSGEQITLTNVPMNCSKEQQESYKNSICARLPSSLGIVPLNLQPMSTLQHHSSNMEDGKSVSEVETRDYVVHRSTASLYSNRNCCNLQVCKLNQLPNSRSKWTG